MYSKKEQIERTINILNNEEGHRTTFGSEVTIQLYNSLDIPETKAITKCAAVWNKNVKQIIENEADIIRYRIDIDITKDPIMTKHKVYEKWGNFSNEGIRLLNSLEKEDIEKMKTVRMNIKRFQSA